MNDDEARKLAIEMYGGEEAFQKANKAAADALAALLSVVGGHTLQAVANAAGLLFVAVVRADGGTLEKARYLVDCAWDSQTVDRITEMLTVAVMPDNPNIPIGKA